MERLQLKNDFRNLPQPRSLKRLLGFIQAKEAGRKGFSPDLPIFHPTDRPYKIARERSHVSEDVQTTSRDRQGADRCLGVEAKKGDTAPGRGDIEC